MQYTDFCRLKSAQTAGSNGTYVVWQLCGNPKGRWFLLGQSVLYCIQPGGKTRLKAGDIDKANAISPVVMDLTGSCAKKISLKIMTLNNSFQKSNDCLGNPVGIGIAVTWSVLDTAKAVFAVDNYVNGIGRR